jgi:hypothetical protein
VPEYDAFGREIGEDPLKNLRDATNRAETWRRELPSADAAPAEAPGAETPRVDTPRAETPRVEVPAAESPRVEVADADLAAWSGAHEPDPESQRIAIAPPTFIRPRRRRRGFGLAGLLVLVAGIGALGLVANSAVEEGKDLIDRAIPELPAEPEAPSPVGLEPKSLIREDNLAVALRKLADSDLGRPTSLRIAPDRIDAQLIQGDTLHVVQITPRGELREFGSSQGSGRPIAFKAIDPAAPERLVRRAATRKSPPRSIDYLVVSPGPPQTVGAYFKSGRIVIGDAHGRPQRVL